MGFDAGLYVYPKYKDVTYSDLLTIEQLLQYENSEWAKTHYKSAEEYAQNYGEDKYILQSKERIDFYREHLVPSEFGSLHIWQEYAYWGGNGSGKIYDYITQLGEKASTEYSSTVILSKKDIANFMEFCLDYIIKRLPQTAYITHGFKYQRNEEGEILEDGDITLFNVDGFEVEYVDDEGNTSLKRMESDPEYGCSFGFPNEYYDEYEFSGYLTGLEACAKILSEVDDNSFIVYNGGC